MTQYEKDSPHTLVILYEPSQAAELIRFKRERPHDFDGAAVIVFGLDVEAALRELSIGYISGRTYKRYPPRLLEEEDEMMSGFFADPRWNTFAYRGIPLPITFRFMFRSYLQRVLYYADLLISVLEAHTAIRRLVLFAPSGGFIPSLAGTLAPREVSAVVDCARTLGALRGIAVDILPTPSARTAAPHGLREFWFLTKRHAFGVMLSVWNMCIGLIRRSGGPRLIISDYWRNVEPIADAMREGECIFIDRSEIRHIPWRSLLRYRMRFVHGEDFLTRTKRRRATDAAQALRAAWEAIRKDHTQHIVCRGYVLDPLLVAAMDDIVNGLEKTLCEIEGTYALYEHYSPDVVLLRASVSGQTHFSVMPLVAKAVGIPSVELQHGLEYLGAGSWSREHVAEHIAVYGPLVKSELVTLGYAPERIHEIGSPRFDHYQKIESHTDPSHLTILCIAPDIRPHPIYDSYGAEDYLAAVANAARAIQHARVIIKLRAGPAGETLLHGIVDRAFANVSHRVSQRESLADLFAEADVVVSCYSTAVLEALICDKAVILPALNPIDVHVVDFHFAKYRDAGVLAIAYSETDVVHELRALAHREVRDAAREKGRAFLTRHYSFDGKSSERSAALLHELARSRRQGTV